MSAERYILIGLKGSYAGTRQGELWNQSMGTTAGKALNSDDLDRFLIKIFCVSAVISEVSAHADRTVTPGEIIFVMSWHS